MRHIELLGARDPMMFKLVPALVREMGAAYAELPRAQGLIEETLQLEETRFRKTLDRGLKLLDEETANLKEGDKLSGTAAFKLYDTYGFPLDLTQDALRARGISVDTDVFASEMARQKAEARKAWTGSGEAKTETIWFDVRDKQGASEFLGYDTERAEGVVKSIVQDGKELTALAQGQSGQIVLNQTPFYAESGGQVGDEGMIRTADGARFRVTSTTKRLGDLFIHAGVLEHGVLKAGDAVELEVDHTRRSATRMHHSATHLLHEALRRVLGTHVAQKGSLVEPGRLRFDFSHTKPMSEAETAETEAIANRIVSQNDAVSTRLMSVDDAIAEGAMALFGEKYGDEVRVVSMGRGLGADDKPVYSLELCGGTHVGRTGDIGLIKIVAESGSAAGVRRLEALAGDAARDYLNAQDKRLSDTANVLKVSPADVPERVAALVEQARRLERELSDAKRKLAMGGGGAADEAAVVAVNGVNFMGRVLQGLDPKDLKPMADEAKKTIGSGVIALAAVSDDGKGAIVVAVTDDLTGKFSAVDLVRLGSAAMGGKGGGGRPDMAQAGGPDGANAAAAVGAVKGAI